MRSLFWHKVFCWCVTSKTGRSSCTGTGSSSAAAWRGSGSCSGGPTAGSGGTSSRCNCRGPWCYPRTASWWDHWVWDSEYDSWREGSGHHVHHSWIDNRSWPCCDSGWGNGKSSFGLQSRGYSICSQERDLGRSVFHHDDQHSGNGYPSCIPCHHGDGTWRVGTH